MRWLAECCGQPWEALRAWEREESRPIPSTGSWRVIEAPLLRSVDAMQRIGYDRLGQILAAPGAGLARWPAPSEDADQLDDLRLLTVPPAGWLLKCPSAGTGADGRIWLTGPDGSGQLTAAGLLGAAFGPAGAVTP